MKKVILTASGVDWCDNVTIYFKNKKLYAEYEQEDLEISDGYHTMDELYNHRYALFCALIKIYDNYITPLNTSVKCWKSKLHSDGTMFEGNFIVGMTIKEFSGPPSYITYHLPLDWWNKVKVMEIQMAPMYDGHTNDDVIERLMKL